MRGEWQLRDWESEYWMHKIENYIKDLCRNIDKIDLTREDINPYQLWQVLEQLGWERDDDIDTNGWEQDMWMTFHNPHYDNDLIVFSCGMIFSLEMFLKEE